jgi:hypothetical protein
VAKKDQHTKQDKVVEFGKVRVKRVRTLPVHDQLDDDVVSSMTESFLLSGGGPINPIVVRRVASQEGGKSVVQTVLVAGAHRLEAARRAGMKRIACKYIEGDETDARIVQIEENLFRKDLTALHHAELLSEWVGLAQKKGYISGQRVRKNKYGRPQGGLSKFARELPTVGRSFEARRKIIQRATKIAAISSAAKVEARAAGLDDNQRALLIIAKAGGPKAQIKKAKELSQSLRQATSIDGTDADTERAIEKQEPVSSVEIPRHHKNSMHVYTIVCCDQVLLLRFWNRTIRNSNQKWP